MCFTHGSWARWAATSRFPFMITNVCMRSCNLRIFWATEVFFHSVDCRGEVYHRQICHIYSGISKHNFLFSLHLDHHLVSQIVSQFPGSFSSSLHCFWSVWVHTVSVLFLVVVYCFNYCVHLRSFFGSLRGHFASVSFCVSFVILCLLLLWFEVLFATLCHLLPFLYFVWVFLPPNDFVCPVSLQFCFFCLFCHISLFFLISCLSFGSLCAELLCILCYLFIVHALWSFLSLLSFILLAHSAPIFV